jgi:phage host-nuclease inhibitor protein Gam
MNYRNLCQKLIELVRKERQQKEALIKDIWRIGNLARREKKLYEAMIDELREGQEESRGRGHN